MKKTINLIVLMHKKTINLIVFSLQIRASVI